MIIAEGASPVASPPEVAATQEARGLTGVDAAPVPALSREEIEALRRDRDELSEQMLRRGAAKLSRRDLAARFAARATLREGVGAVSAIGAGINARFENLRRTLETLASMGAPVLGASTSSFRISVLLAEKDVPEAVRRLHLALVTEGERPRSTAD